VNIYQKLNAVRKKVAYLKKDAVVQGYRAVTHDMVTAAAREHMIEQGILVVPSIAMDSEEKTDHRVVEGTTAKGGFKLRYEAVYGISFVNIDDPEDRLMIHVSAHADDHGDKAPGKALSYAVKYALLKVLMIETGENDEGRIDNAPAYTEIQKGYFDTYVSTSNGLGLYLFKSRVGDDVYTALYNSAPDGKKTKLKSECRELEQAGAQAFVKLAESIEGDDMLGAVEVVTEQDRTTQHLIMNALDSEMRGKLLAAMKEAE